jgi:hypothetical protein
MELHTFNYQTDIGWSVDQFPPLDSEDTLVIVFGAPEFIDNPDCLVEISRAYPSSAVIGCSTAGEIFDTTVHDHSLSVAVVGFKETKVETAGSQARSAQESFAAGESLAEQLFRPTLRGVFVLSDGTYINGSELVRGLNSVLPESVVVTGGLAGDGERFERTWVLRDGEPQAGCVSAVGFYGKGVCIGHGSKGGWDIFGPERRVTCAEGNILYELDGKPALQLYKEYLGELAVGLPATALLFPLALKTEMAGTESVVRTVLAVDESKNSMIFAGDIPEGQMAQLMKANFDRLIDGAAGAALQTWQSNPQNKPMLSIAISCVGRRLVLGERTEEELEAALEIFPSGTLQVGFYSYGEISPYTEGFCDLHNQTMTLTTITEV